MNPWPFVSAAYAIGVGAKGWLVLASLWTMRRAESAADALTRR